MLTTPLRPGVLTQEVGIGAGVRVGVDVMAPCRWLTVSAPALDGSTTPLVTALIGSRAVHRLAKLLDQPPAVEPRSIDVDPAGSSPWLRVAVVGSLDRWLQLPLEQALVDAERGVALARAATTLPAGGAARARVIGEALDLARHASDGVVRQLRSLARRAAVPPPLAQALERVVDGYRDLLAEVDGGADSALAAVPRAWQRLIRALDVPERPATRTRPRTRRRSGCGSDPGPGPGSRIDPRQVRARVFALSEDPLSAEIRLFDTPTGDGPAVTVRVPAYGRTVDRTAAPRLLVRIIDPRSAVAVGQSVLLPAAGTGRRGTEPYFEGVVPIDVPATDELRADVFDALSTVPPVASDEDEELSQARRAAIFLGEWRRLHARLQLRAERVDLPESLRVLIVQVSAQEDPDPARPLFAGGPSPSDVLRLADLDDATLRTAGDDRAACSRGLLRMVHGPGALLLAELAAVLLD